MRFITGKTLEELTGEFKELGAEPYRARQVLRWIYKKRTFDFDSMTDLPKDLRRKLSETYAFHPLELVDMVEAPDATKFLFRTQDGHLVETVLIRERDHLTLCVSSQIGCAVGCTFCATALDGLIRNLRTEEIIDQYLQVQSFAQERIRNVVFMGMGEPLANYENVRKSALIMVSPWGLDLSKRRVTISTSGLVNPLKRLAKDDFMRSLNLAVSVNAPTQELRRTLMPLTETNTLRELFEVLKGFPLPRYRRITLEYVLIKDINDSPEHAHALADLIGNKKGRFKVNLIPFNPDPKLPYSRPPLERVFAFQKVLWERGISVFVRFSKGADAFGACGQLRAKRAMLKS